MAIRIYKAMTPGTRGMSVINYRDAVDKVKPLASLTRPLRKKAGRNNTGRITVRHRGGGHKRRYRIIDFKRRKHDVPAKVEYIEYDPNRTSFIARLLYQDGERAYIIAPEGVKKGDVLVTGAKVDVKPGNAMPLSSMPLGSIIHNIEMKPGKGAQMARSAGSSVQLVGRVNGYAQLKMPSGEMRRVPESCLATFGSVSNGNHFNVKIGKAGKKRWMGIRPTVRGVAMNPVDHPHGGGEGRTSGGRHPVTPWAVSTKGHKTRNNKRTNKDIIRRRSKKRRK